MSVLSLSMMFSSFSGLRVVSCRLRLKTFSALFAPRDECDGVAPEPTPLHIHRLSAHSRYKPEWRGGVPVDPRRFCRMRSDPSAGKVITDFDGAPKAWLVGSRASYSCGFRHSGRTAVLILRVEAAEKL